MNDWSELLPEAFPSESGDGGPGRVARSHIALSFKDPVVPWDGSPAQARYRSCRWSSPL